MVARKGVDAMMKGDIGVVSGFANTNQATTAHLVPAGILAGQHRKIAELGIYPAVDPLDSTSRILDPEVVPWRHWWRGHVGRADSLCRASALSRSGLRRRSR